MWNTHSIFKGDLPIVRNLLARNSSGDSDSDSTLESNCCFKDLVVRENVGELALKLESESEF